MNSHPTAPHPAQPEPVENDEDAPNTSQQPVEPEFGQALPPAEPEDPGTKPPHI